MSNLISLQQRRAEAEQTVRRFVRRFEPSYHALACHAALPLVLTPELVNYLRNEFLRNEEVPWVAEIDLLLSDLCRPVGYELYAMDTDVRAYLLTELERQFGRSRIQQVAKLLISYVRYLAETSASVNEKELEAQQWAAMVYLDENQRQTAVRQIAKKFRAGGAVANQVGERLVDSSELARLAQITTELAPELANYPDLLDYAALVSEVIVGDGVVEIEQTERSYEVLPGYEVKLPESLVARGRGRLLTTAEAVVIQPDLLPLKNLEFETGKTIKTQAKQGWPPLQSEIVEVVTVEFEANEPTILGAELVTFTFQVATLERAERSLFRRNWNLRKQQGQTQCYLERLTNGILITMVAVPGGSFVMGSPLDEPERLDTEGPQHDVRVSDFFMGRYPITQEQWRAVAAMPQQNRELDPDPSRFKGDNRPVESVNWFDAVEFCARLSVHTGREYRLPTEAEWEYACRARTTTPFSFGDMITTEVANYYGNYVYNNGPKGKFPDETTPVDYFKIANSFGLSDMHGNTYEWCQDQWHSSYEGAPASGDAWIDEGAEQDVSRVTRGGSWNYDPWNCRSANRNSSAPNGAISNIGLRVVCSASRTSE